LRVAVIRMKQPDCPVVRLSTYLPSIEIYIIDSRLVSNYLRVVALIKHYEVPRKLIHELLIKSGAKSTEFITTSSNTSLIVIKCSPTKAFECMCSKSLTFKPLIAKGGSEDWVVVTPSRRVANEVLNDLRVSNEVEVITELSVGIKEAPIIALLTSPESLIRLSNLIKDSLLTNQQGVVVSKALSMGYYSSPREADLGDLARELRLSKAAVAKVLRRAERKAMNLVLNLTKVVKPYLSS